MTDVLISFAGRAVSIRCDDGAARQFIDSLFHDLAGDETACPDTTLTLGPDLETGGYQLAGEGTILGGGPLGVGLAALLFDAVIAGLLERNAEGLALHAGAVASHDKVVLLPGVSGAGKSTITAWLVAQGCSYLTDELVFFGDDLPARMLAFTRPLCIKPGAAQVVRPLIRTDVPAALADEQGLIVPHRAVNPAFAPVAALPALILFPAYHPETPITVERISTARTIALLMGCNVNGRNLVNHGFSRVTRLASSAPAHRVVYSRFEDLAAVLPQLLAGSETA